MSFFHIYALSKGLLSVKIGQSLFLTQQPTHLKCNRAKKKQSFAPQQKKAGQHRAINAAFQPSSIQFGLNQFFEHVLEQMDILA